MPDKVADASVLGAIIFEKSRAEEAKYLVFGDDLHGPRLLAFELGSVARHKVIFEGRSLDDVVDLLGTAANLKINWVDVDHVATLRLAIQTRLSTYDASYLYVAQRLSAPLVTFDTKLQAAYTSLGP